VDSLLQNGPTCYLDIRKQVNNLCINFAIPLVFKSHYTYFAEHASLVGNILTYSGGTFFNRDYRTLMIVNGFVWSSSVLAVKCLYTRLT